MKLKWPNTRWPSDLVVSGRNIGTKSKPAIDPVQEALLSEPCILVDEQDRAIGQASKKDCHRMVEGGSLLHRAFSLFIFNNKGDLLLQKRSATKITFPNMWTNTCCSHPLVMGDEMKEENAWGVRLAAQRKVNSELGIAESEVLPENIQYLTRILYSAPSSGDWGEHELDYILLHRGDVLTIPNPEEVSEIEWVSRDKLPEFLNHVENTGGEITPWFRLITQNLLPLWWKNLDNIEKHFDHTTIHKFT
ncbi:isopentenyl-diphosphate Delta-isomerase 1 [Eurytemora carolleeae]|uniref:isopentenyl-diphosphate Delta-isomerase 1 n=1 Tax=Eurytemora carolleeae TaxID=1294199 RepID=UPI000C757E23|nr:isopentenyl-diphosphate Delta-isomerase 1 [Eurytemora carolleeae]|eukprot:XP_023320062.1 isopentenyl-diphosphate Delta-isomerase 1-like [Eurytemora affinis]